MTAGKDRHNFPMKISPWPLFLVIAMLITAPFALCSAEKRERAATVHLEFVVEKLSEQARVARLAQTLFRTSGA